MPVFRIPKTRRQTGRAALVGFSPDCPELSSSLATQQQM